jgi:3-hydroxyisobutyrate dehydrogenase-like beta-hydroxyacid dehydrogenase
MSEPVAPLGFIGLGNMGGPIAANIARAGHPMVVYDAAGTAERAPEGAIVAASVADVVRQAEIVLLCLPDGGIVRSVAQEMLETNDRRVRTVVDNSTVGLAAARAVHAMLLDGEVEYADAPVSGGVAGARKGTVSVMYAGAGETLERVRPYLESMSANIFHLGEQPGQGQAMKVLNNFLSATALAATSEAVAFGMGQGLEMATMLAALNVSTGQNTATSEKFPNRILTETYDAGFTSKLLLKDLLLYEEALREAGGSRAVSRSVIDVWRRLEQAYPATDITRMYPFVRDEEGGDG